jgi:riboflavin kinase / FMN adenylyltransferase
LTTLPGAMKALPSMTYVGTRPTVNSGERLIETHLFDFDGDLYGQIIHVEILERLRGDEVFSGIDELISQLQQDEKLARSYLSDTRPGASEN